MIDIDSLEVARLDTQIKRVTTMLEEYFGKVMSEARNLDRIIGYMEEWSRHEPKPDVQDNIAYMLFYLRGLSQNLHHLGTFTVGSPTATTST